MALETRHLLAGTAIALVIGAGVAWQQRTPPRDAALAPGLAPPAPATDTPAPTLYKWRDDQGVWNYTDTPPPDRPYETITGTPNVNSVPSVVPDGGVSEPGAPPTP